MGIPDDKDAAVRWFFETLFALSEQLSEQEFAAFREWIEFIAGEPPVAH